MAACPPLETVVSPAQTGNCSSWEFSAPTIAHYFYATYKAAIPHPALLYTFLIPLFPSYHLLLYYIPPSTIQYI